MLTELSQSRKSYAVLEARCKQPEAATGKLGTLELLRIEAKRARDAEQHLRAEVERQRPGLQRLPELQDLVLVPQPELAFLRDQQCDAEIHIRRLANLEVSLEKARDTITELKALVAALKTQVHQPRGQALKNTGMENSKFPATRAPSPPGSATTQQQHPSPDNTVNYELHNPPTTAESDIAEPRREGMRVRSRVIPPPKQQRESPKSKSATQTPTNEASPPTRRC